MNTDRDIHTDDDTIPILVDLDGALVATDTLYESAILYLKKTPWLFFMLPVWLLSGKQKLKKELSDRTSLNVDTLPYRDEVIRYLKKKHAEGRTIILMSGSWVDIVERVAAQFPFIQYVIATDLKNNMTGAIKAQIAKDRWGERQFDYLGNEEKDLHVWRHSRRAIVVGDGKLASSAGGLAKVDRHFNIPSLGIRTWLKAIRIHQWTKNALIFVPLLTSHSFTESHAVVSAILAFISFGMCSSATYLLNDLLDLESDRKHTIKKKRPIAAGTMSIPQACISFMILICAGLFIAASFVNGFFLTSLAAYLTLTILYSFKLKQLQTLDVISLASLFTIRIIAGSAAIGVSLSFWLLCFSMFMFLSLAIVKRVSELVHVEKEAGTISEKVSGRGYFAADIVVLLSLGGASGFISVLVFALYINSEAVLEIYQRPEVLWLVIPILGYWIMRIWIVTARGQMDEDPISFAISDKNSLFAGSVMLLMFALATIL